MTIAAGTTDISGMATLNIFLPDDLYEALEARVSAGIYSDVDSYVLDLVRADLVGDDWLTPEVIAAMDARRQR